MMTSKLNAGIRRIVAIGGIAYVIVAMSACTNQNSSRLSGDRVAAVKPATNQRTALRMAQQEDIPALDAADKIVIQTAPWAGAKEVAITSAAHLKQLRSALIVKETPPSGGETWATLTWMNGERTIREIWVFDYGEWGFERPSTSWTIGHNGELVAIINKHLSTTTEGKANKADAGDGK